jgi:hypothetical protein
VGRFAGEGLRRSEAVLLVATAAHGRAIVRRLESEGLAPAAASRRGQLTVLDATASLSRVLADGVPEPARFQETIGRAVASAKSAGYPTVRVFGEMADLLRRTSEDAALRLEELWNGSLAEPGIALLCSYSLDSFDPELYEGVLQRVVSTHSHLVPVEDYARLDQAVAHAYAEVFGIGQDAGYLRRTFLAHYTRPAAMPDGQAAILAAREHVPREATAALLERVRQYYQSRSAAA